MQVGFILFIYFLSTVKNTTDFSKTDSDYIDAFNHESDSTTALFDSEFNSPFLINEQTFQNEKSNEFSMQNNLRQSKDSNYLSNTPTLNEYLLKPDYCENISESQFFPLIPSNISDNFVQQQKLNTHPNTQSIIKEPCDFTDILNNSFNNSENFDLNNDRIFKKLKLADDRQTPSLLKNKNNLNDQDSNILSKNFVNLDDLLSNDSQNNHQQMNICDKSCLSQMPKKDFTLLPRSLAEVFAENNIFLNNNRQFKSLDILYSKISLLSSRITPSKEIEASFIEIKNLNSIQTLEIYEILIDIGAKIMFFRKPIGFILNKCKTNYDKEHCRYQILKLIDSFLEFNLQHQNFFQSKEKYDEITNNIFNISKDFNRIISNFKFHNSITEDLNKAIDDKMQTISRNFDELNNIIGYIRYCSKPDYNILISQFKIMIKITQSSCKKLIHRICILFRSIGKLIYFYECHLKQFYHDYLNNYIKAKDIGLDISNLKHHKNYSAYFLFKCSFYFISDEWNFILSDLDNQSKFLNLFTKITIGIFLTINDPKVSTHILKDDELYKKWTNNLDNLFFDRFNFDFFTDFLKNFPIFDDVINDESQTYDSAIEKSVNDNNDCFLPFEYKQTFSKYLRLFYEIGFLSLHEILK